MKKKSSLYLLIVSIFLVLIFSFVFDIGHRVGSDNSRFYGFPAEWMGLYSDGTFSFMLLGLLFNIALFYLICFVLLKIFKK